MHFSKIVFPPHHKGSQAYEVLAIKKQFPFPPYKFIWIPPCSLSSRKMLPLKTVIQSDSTPERQTKIQGDSPATCSLLLLIKMLELLICIHYNLLVWHATQTISSCHQTTKALISNGRTGAFWHSERKTEQNKKRDAEVFMSVFLPGWEGERYNSF